MEQSVAEQILMKSRKIYFDLKELQQLGIVHEKTERNCMSKGRPLLPSQKIRGKRKYKIDDVLKLIGAAK